MALDVRIVTRDEQEAEGWIVYGKTAVNADRQGAYPNQHFHSFGLEINGDGVTTTEGIAGEAHYHPIINCKVQKANGHTHTISLPKEAKEALSLRKEMLPANDNSEVKNAETVWDPDKKEYVKNEKYIGNAEIGGKFKETEPDPVKEVLQKKAPWLLKKEDYISEEIGLVAAVGTNDGEPLPIGTNLPQEKPLEEPLQENPETQAIRKETAASLILSVFDIACQVDEDFVDSAGSEEIDANTILTINPDKIQDMVNKGMQQDSEMSQTVNKILYSPADELIEKYKAYIAALYAMAEDFMYAAENSSGAQKWMDLLLELSNQVANEGGIGDPGKTLTIFNMLRLVNLDAALILLGNCDGPNNSKICELFTAVTLAFKEAMQVRIKNIINSI